MTVTAGINYTNFYTTMLCLIIKSKIIHLLEQNSDTKVGVTAQGPAPTGVIAVPASQRPRNSICPRPGIPLAPALMVLTIVINADVVFRYIFFFVRHITGRTFKEGENEGNYEQLKPLSDF